MSRDDHQYPLRDAILFSQKIAHLSKALWKSIEKDWQQWIKPYDLNINEHHILWIAYHLNGASISEIAKFGVMHVSTAFNFSKKLEERGLLNFSKKEDDKRNTYVELTPEGERILLETMENYDPEKYGAYKAASPLRELYGKFPEMVEFMCIVRNIYGEDFMEIFEKSFENLNQEFVEEEGRLIKKEDSKANELQDINREPVNS